MAASSNSGETPHADKAAALKSKLSWMLAGEDRTLFLKEIKDERIILCKKEQMLYLIESYFDGADWQPGYKLSGLDLQNPLHIDANYGQAMSLCMGWAPQAEQIYLLGFGGGALALHFQHYYPEVKIRGSEIEPLLLQLSADYFGIDSKQNIEITIGDGRQDLAQKTSHGKFDIILLDAFISPGIQPHTLSTLEFYKVCKQALKPKGVVACNFVASVEHYGDRMKTFKASFKHVYEIEVQAGVQSVLFGNDDAGSDIEVIKNRLRALNEAHRFEYPFLEWAEKLKEVPDHFRYADCECLVD